MLDHDRIADLLQQSLQIVRRYDWLLDAYVLDFHVEEHWSKLPAAWRENLENVEPQTLSDLLQYDESRLTCRRVWPLELLALKAALKALCINRRPQNEEKMPESKLLAHPKLKHIFTKSVKAKKRHELLHMASICKRSCDDLDVDFVVDFGAGLGHLARVLGYGFGIAVCCLEMRDEFNRQARVIDEHLETMAAKYIEPRERAAFRRPAHVTLRLTADMSAEEFLRTIRDALQLPSSDFRFGIIGLHPCGDLGAILMRLFLNCSQAKFLNFVGCCYMKLSTPQDIPATTKQPGYPLSACLQEKGSLCRLSYEAREISCHASETYCDRLLAGRYEHLRVHSFRAATERVIRTHWPDMQRCGLRSVKHTPGMRFEDAVEGLIPAKLPLSALQTPATQADLLQWQRIIVFYTLRLMLAPLVESVILYDRILFLRENDCQIRIRAIFEPRLSPRNHITSAYKFS